MKSKVWIRKALSMCLTVAIIATYSMVALAGEKVTGELLVSGNNVVKVNGEAAQSGRSIFSSSTIATPDNAGAVINLGKIGKIQLAPNTDITLSFNEKGISGDLLSGRVTVLSASETVSIRTMDGKLLSLAVGESAGVTSAQDDDDDDDGYGSLWIWAAIAGGAIAGVVIAANSDNNRIALGQATVVVSPVR